MNENDYLREEIKNLYSEIDLLNKNNRQLKQHLLKIEEDRY